MSAEKDLAKHIARDVMDIENRIRKIRKIHDKYKDSDSYNEGLNLYLIRDKLEKLMKAMESV